MRAALDAEARLPPKNRDRIDRILEELATGDLSDLQERYVCYSTAPVRCRCICLSTCTPKVGIVARPWST